MNSVNTMDQDPRCDCLTDRYAGTTLSVIYIEDEPGAFQVSGHSPPGRKCYWVGKWVADCSGSSNLARVLNSGTGVRDGTSWSTHRRPTWLLGQFPRRPPYAVLLNRICPRRSKSCSCTTNSVQEPPLKGFKIDPPSTPPLSPRRRIDFRRCTGRSEN